MSEQKKRIELLASGHQKPHFPNSIPTQYLTASFYLLSETLYWVWPSVLGLLQSLA